MRYFSQKILLVCLMALLVWSFGFAQENLKEICELNRVDQECEKLSQTECQKLLQKCLDYYQKESEKYQGKLEITRQTRRTLQNQIAYLENKINKLNNEIYHNNLLIKHLNYQINDTQKSIEETSQKIEATKTQIREILRAIYEIDKRPLIEILIEEDSLSSFFDELVALEALTKKNQELLQNIKQLKQELEEKEESLVAEKENLEKTVIAYRLKQKEAEEAKYEKYLILKKTKGKESLYQAYLEEMKEKAEEIRKRIFRLAQVAESEAPSYEEAYRLAKSVEEVTGVRAALLLGLLEVESAIGRNVGQCNCKGRTYCRHPDISWKEVMSKSQWDAFLQITKELGLDPNSTPVSCAINGGKVQWGGAMGPAQFMPNTWLKLGYKERVERILGVKPANPWRVKDAFLAAALYLSDWGASSQRLQDEIGAVTAYLCGTSRMTARCKRAGGEGYRYAVMEKAAQWQKWIDEGVFEK